MNIDKKILVGVYLTYDFFNMRIFNFLLHYFIQKYYINMVEYLLTLSYLCIIN
jgi:hypothetical protein